jgi:hypothetical protein
LIDWSKRPSQLRRAGYTVVNPEEGVPMKENAIRTLLFGDEKKILGVHPRVPKLYREGCPKMSHFEGAFTELLERIEEAIKLGERIRKGYFPGTMVVKIAPDKVFCKGGEKHLSGTVKASAQLAEIVLYDRKTLLARHEEMHHKEGLPEGVDLFVVAVHGFPGSGEVKVA